MKNLESFNKLSKVDNYYSEKKEENLLPDYDGLTYVRLMKKFKPKKVDFEFTFENIAITELPSFKGLKDKIEADEEIILNKEINEPFHLRCYLPKNNITRKTFSENEDVIRDEKKTHRVVIMFNGMNEIEHFDLYDILGEYFTDNGMSAILLPTPFHLNRRVFKKVIDRETKKEINLKFLPTEFARMKDDTDKSRIISNGDLFYYSFLKSYNELKELIDRIHGRCNYDSDTENSELEKTFYETYFHHKGESIEIILFGYSLGGLRAVSYFLNDPELFRCCISFNSGANLLDSHTEELRIRESEWDDMLLNVQLKVDNYTSRQTEKNEKEIGFTDTSDKGIDKVVKLRHAFLSLYFGERNGNIRQELLKNNNRYLAISGGSDKIVNIDQMKSIAPKKKHIHQVIVAGVDHHPTKDPNWYNVLPRIEKNIVDFINTCDEEHWTKERVVKEMVRILKGINYFKAVIEKFTQENLDTDPSLEFGFQQLNDLLKEINTAKGDTAKNDFITFYYISKAYYPSFEELIIKIGRELRS